MNTSARLFLSCCALSLSAFSPLKAFAQVTQNENGQYEFQKFGFETEEDKQAEELAKKPFNPYDKKYRPASQTANSGEKSLMPNYYFLGAFLRKLDAKPDDINIRIISPGTVTGCLKNDVGTAEITYRGVEAYINIGSTPHTVDKETPRYSPYSCRISSNGTEVDLTLSKQELLDRNIKKLVFSRPGIGNYSGMNITIKPSHIALDRVKTMEMPEGYKAPKLPGHAEYWFYPENTLILSDASLNYTPENISKLESFARAKGLTPLKDIYTDFDLPQYPHNAVFYAVDDKNIYAEDIQNSPNGFTIGTLDVPQKIYASQGEELRMVRSNIRARMPGLYE